MYNDVFKHLFIYSAAPFHALNYLQLK
jgi:hypothetical protein